MKRRALEGDGQILAAFALLVSLLTLSEYLFRWNLGIDELFIKDPYSPPELFPGRMSPIAVLCAVLGSTSLLQIGSRISQYLSIGVFALSLLTIIGFLFDFQALFRHPQNTFSAVQTAVAFLLFSLGLLAARPTQGMMQVLLSDLPGSKAMRLLLPGIVLLTIVMGWLVERAERLGILDPNQESIFLVVLLIFVYSPLIYSIAKNVNQAEERILYANRLYATLSQVNEAIVRVKSQQELFETICNIAVDFGGFRLAWIGRIDPQSGYLTPVAVCSSEEIKLPFEDVNLNEMPFQEGLIGLALTTGRAQFSDDLLADRRMLHWHEIALKGDYHSAAVIPIRQSGQIVGFLNLYAADIGFFTVKEEQSLLEEMGLDISFALDTMKNESERSLAEERFASAFHSSPMPITITRTRDGKFVDVNEAWCQAFGYTREEAVGRTSAELGITGTEMRQQFMDTLQSQGLIRNIETSLLTRSGEERDMLFSMEMLEINGEPHSLTTLIDITERKHAELQIQSQLQRLKGLRAIDIAISSSFDIQVIFDIVLEQVIAQLGVDAAAILLFNPYDQRMEYAASRGFHSNALHYTRLKVSEGYAGRAVRERQTVHISGLLGAGGKLAEAMQLAKEDFVDYYGTPLIAKEEIKGVLEIYHRSPLDPNPEWLVSMETLAGQAAIAIDNVQLFENLQRANAELELRVVKRTEELSQMNLELEHANRTKDEFLATMSHELRTPLNSILGLSESLLEQRHDPLSDHQQKSLQIIESSGHHLLELINDILDLSKIEAGKFDFYPQVIMVDQLCRGSLAFVKEQAVRKSITMTYQEEITVSKIYVDPRRLKQILVNLLTNAVKFTPEHGQVMLQVHTDEEQDRIQFSVIDNGIGIALQDLKQLFVPFAQVDSSLTREYEGTGLGLALVQKLTDLHGGSVQVESEVGKGSRFTINLPLGKDKVVQPEVIGSGGEVSASKQAGKPNIRADKLPDRAIVLLAEDNPANILTIGDYLESNGYQIVVAHDGSEVITKAEETNPNIILMDIQMPTVNGLEAIGRLRANPRFTATPIIALTALAMPGDREICLEAGANDYMSKPVSLKKLKQRIESFLEA